MCLLCAEIAKGRMTLREQIKAATEVTDKDHVFEKIKEKATIHEIMQAYLDNFNEEPEHE